MKGKKFMDNKMKTLIRTAFDAPPPQKKEEFLRRSAYSPAKKSAWYDMIPAQIGYIHKSAWVCAVMVFAVVLYSISDQNENTVFMIAAFTPFLALSVLVESNRSRRYNMSELEAVTRYSLRSIVFCKMLILGIFDLMFLLFVIAITGVRPGNDMLSSGTYILLPYLLTMWLGLMIERTRIGQETPYAGTGISMLISLILLLMVNSDHRLLHPAYEHGWGILIVVSVIGIVIGIRDKAKCLEDAVWS